MREYRIQEGKGMKPSLPPRTYRPSAAEILKFCRRGQGGRQYAELESALDRLQATRYKITNRTHNNTRRAAESFPLIGRFKIVSRTSNDKIDQVEIEIPDWVYAGVVTPLEAPSILTLNADYFLIQKPLAKFIYRLARKATGARGIAEYGLETLHHRSGSPMPFRKFRESLAELVVQAKDNPLPDFDIEIVPAKDGEKLRMIDRKKLLAMKTAA
ncbi:MAG: replication initiator protein A [Proteobacteria bacterium]|nr:replication initiator protein A [Pseudomonadota bacterium]